MLLSSTYMYMIAVETQTSIVNSIHALPDEGECGVTESVAKFKHRLSCVELVRTSRGVPHAHVEEGNLVDVISWILQMDCIHTHSVWG